MFRVAIIGFIRATYSQRAIHLKQYAITNLKVLYAIAIEWKMQNTMDAKFFFSVFVCAFALQNP